MSRCRLLARTVSGTLSSTWHHPHPPHRHHSHRPDRGVNADGLIRAKRGSSLFQLSTAAFFSASASTSLQSQSQGEAPKAKTNVLVEKLRRFVASTSPSVRALEHVFTLYVPITLSPAASRALADSDFASIASFMIRTAEAHLVVAIPANQSTENEVLDTNESAELDKFQKSISIFKKLWNESAKSATDHAALLSTIASLLGRRMDTSTKLPSIFDSFAKLMLSDIARLRMQIGAQTTTVIPTLTMLRSLANESEAASFLTQLNQLQSTSEPISDDILFSAIISAFGFSQRADLALQFFNALDADENSRPSLGVASCLSICQVLTSANKFDEASVKAFEIICSGRLSPKQSTFNGLFRSLIKAETIEIQQKQKYIRQVVDVFWQRVASSLDGPAYDAFLAGSGAYTKFLNILIQFYAQNDDYDSIIALSKRLEASNIALSPYANNTILLYLFERGMDAIGMMFFDDLRSASFKRLSPNESPWTAVFSNDKPTSHRINIYTINIVLNRVFITYGPHAVLTLFRTLRSEHPDIPADNATYSTVIKACFQSRDLGQAKAIYAEMLNSGVRPDLITSTVLMDGLLKNHDLPSALKVFAYHSDHPQDRVMHTSLIDNLTRLPHLPHHHVHSAYAAFRGSKEEEHPDVVLLNILLGYFLRTRQRSRADALLAEVDAIGLSPDEYTAVAVVHGLVVAEEYGAVEAAALKMIRAGVKVGVQAVTGVVKGLASARRPVDMARWVEATVGKGLLSGEQACVQELVGAVKGTNEGVIREITDAPRKRHLLEGLDTMTLDFKFWYAVVKGFLDSGCVECADVTVRKFVDVQNENVDLASLHVKHLVMRVAKAWKAAKKDDRENKLMEMYQTKIK